VASGATALSITARSASALAGDTFEIQVYDGTANPPGVPGLELHLNDWATGHHDATPPERPLHGQFHATLEPSLGLLPFWEIGAYLQGAVRTDDGVVDWAGVKLRSKFVTPPTFDRHWRFGLNLEVSYVPEVYEADRWGTEIRPIIAWHDDDWLFAVNPILDQPLAGSDASSGPSLEPAAKAWRKVGPVALGLEYYATLGPVGALLPAADQEHYLFQVVDLANDGPLEAEAGVGEGLTPASAGVVFKVILGYSWEPATTTLPARASQVWRSRQ
jgi:hypothetical protein